jgi:hypothetical protein
MLAGTDDSLHDGMHPSVLPMVVLHTCECQGSTSTNLQYPRTFSTDLINLICKKQ